MFAWYAAAMVCYAYIGDVSSSESANGGFIGRCRWFTRGWTLQELLAPRKVVFYGGEWGILGTKTDLKHPISDRTGFAISILDRSQCPSLVSVAMRFSWASERQTTRVEDEAYCLLGIFDVNMPLLYGEGKKAFARLQEEILKTTEDHSIFLWNADVPHSSCNDCPFRSLIAKSPSDFRDCKEHPVKDQIWGDIPSVTSRGLRIYLPLKRLSDDEVRRLGHRNLIEKNPCNVFFAALNAVVEPGSDKRKGIFLFLDMEGKQLGPKQVLQFIRLAGKEIFPALTVAEIETWHLVQCNIRTFYDKPMELCELDIEIRSDNFGYSLTEELPKISERDVASSDQSFPRARARNHLIENFSILLFQRDGWPPFFMIRPPF